MPYNGRRGVGVMDIGYVILLLLVLVYGSTAVILTLRARGRPSGRPEEEPSSPELEANGDRPPGPDGPRPGFPDGESG